MKLLHCHPYLVTEYCRNIYFSLRLSVCVCVSRAFEDVQVFWRVTFNKGTLSVISNDVNLTKELVQTSGSIVCKSGEVICALTLTVRDDEVIKKS